MNSRWPARRNNAMQTDCLILGGGAAGLAAACALQDSGLSVTILEKLDRVGKKILATGNGRCNLSNLDMNPAYYGEAEAFVRTVYEETPPEAVRAFFEKLGLMTASEDGRLYPRTMAASSVLDVLRAGCAKKNITILTGKEVTRLLPSRRGGWSIQTADGEGFFAPRVLMAMGGSAAPNMGTDGSGTRLCDALGHSVSALYPALVQLRCKHAALRSLKGIRVHAALTLTAGRESASETGELLFADYGVSGVCVFQLSRLASPALAAGKPVALTVNFLPEIEHPASWLDGRIALLPETTALTLMTGVQPRLLTQAILKEAQIAPDTPASDLTAAQKQALLDALFAFPLPVTGTQGFQSAQVTRGGVLLDEIDPHTLQSRLFDGLYFAGEVLDVDGPCGGYNLHFAFASALTAVKAML